MMERLFNVLGLITNGLSQPYVCTRPDLINLKGFLNTSASLFLTNMVHPFQLRSEIFLTGCRPHLCHPAREGYLLPSKFSLHLLRRP